MATLRQFKTAVLVEADHTTWSATFDSAPLDGSLLVAVAGFQGRSSEDQKEVEVVGFTLLVPPPDGAVPVLGAAKLAGAAESSTVTVNLLAEYTTGSSSLIIAEFEGDFDAGSMSNALGQAFGSSGTGVSTLTCPALAITGTHLVVPMLGVNSEATSPTIDLEHTIIAYARQGTATWGRSVAAAHKMVTDDAAHAPTWSWTTDVTARSAGQMAFPVAAGASQLDTPNVTVDATTNPTTAEANDGTADVSWGAITGASAYRVELAPGLDATTGFDVVEENHATTSIQLTGLGEGDFTVGVTAKP